VKRLHEKILNDAAPSCQRPWIVVAGDMLDRGPQSAQVLDFMIDNSKLDGYFVCLCGNHEAMMLDFVDAPQASHPWLSNGGEETLLSYGLQRPVTDRSAARVAAALPIEHLTFLRGLSIAFETELVFVSHAGIRPGVALGQQHDNDLLWFHDDMESDYHDSEKIIVHGHQVVRMPAVGKRRINVDTGAYATGHLTAIRLVADLACVLSVAATR
jgi:serine/threonine protein phosphatase 1